MAGGLVAAVLLGGVAVAAGQGVLPTPFGDGDESPAPDSVRPTQGAPETPGVHRTGGSGPSPVESPTPPGTPTAATSAPRSPHPHPLASEDRSRDEAALCRVYTKDRDHGKAADAEAFDRLRAAASDASDAAVTAYCEALLGRREPGPQGNSGETAAPAAPAASDGPAASHGSHGGGSGKGGPERPEAPGGRAPGGTVGGGPEGAASGGRNGAAVR
ncbi:hypothetical protein Sfulv_37610 [Streptomyces fulvorobeus]|nr:hypothetical protein [Streptomyces fulvorobeus]GFM98950.1 hypothetical protein Sfulv_37610 [Streptomyces fulvorobeus]